MSAAVVRQVIDALPPNAWEVSVWQNAGLGQTFVNGRIDRADQFRIVGLVLAQVLGDRHERACDKCGVPVLLAVHDTGNPMPVEVAVNPSGWLDVWLEDGWLRVSGTNLGTHLGATRHEPHKCQVPSLVAG